ncbi:DUF1289 domain-containing protein [Comamonas koreensis]|uniref:DUF1289 domain-containing protein n=1 Tax=Comamonas koreensis TaxID=160825 RepID=A0AAW4XQ66_9BURK|nr:DUF1289 domain-containing protein [Comamonas koreensis]MCD2163541.1 DUF1289 domain-containing protein [Comamonas koreensis]
MTEQVDKPVALPVASPAPLAARTKQVRVTGAFAAGYADVVPSPCVSLCKMNADRSHCIGCYRSIDEIRAWSKADTAERQQIWLQALGRAGLGTNGRPLVPTV